MVTNIFFPVKLTSWRQLQLFHFPYLSSLHNLIFGQKQKWTIGIMQNRQSGQGKSVCSLLIKEYATIQIIILYFSINMTFKLMLPFISLYFSSVCYLYTDIHLKVSMTSSLFKYIQRSLPIFILLTKFLWQIMIRTFTISSLHP